MIVLIDGYNLLRQVFCGLGVCAKKARDEFIQRLGIYANAHKASIKQIILVFDAGPFVHASREVRHGIVIIYSGQRKSADEWIIDYVQEHKGGEFAVVTMDRVLGECCIHYGASIIDVHDFYQFVIQASVDRQVHDISQNAVNDTYLDELEDIHNGDMPIGREELELLMTIASENIRPKDDYLSSECIQKKRSSNPNKLSKKIRKELAMLKKLR